MRDGPVPAPPVSSVPPFRPPPRRGLLDLLWAWLRARPQPVQTAPAPAALLRAAPLPLPAARPAGLPRVLVVDDDPFQRSLVAIRLGRLGLETQLAADGAEAVARACELEFDLVLMDLQMPVLDGLAATVAIRRFETATRRAAVPVLAHSATAVARTDLARHGLNGSLRKPCGDAELVACLLRWCPRYGALPGETPRIRSAWRATPP